MFRLTNIPKARSQITALLVTVCVGLSVLTSYAQTLSEPSWWQNGVIDESTEENNYATANVGQAKFMALMAIRALNEVLPSAQQLDEGSIPPVPSNPTDAWYEEQLSAVNVGQLKYLVQPIYDKLNQIEQAWLLEQFSASSLTEGTDYFINSDGNYYPWNPDTPVEENYAVANIGQLKTLFLLRFETLGGGIESLIAATSYDTESNPDQNNIIRNVNGAVGFIRNDSWIGFEDFEFPGRRRYNFTISASSGRAGGAVEVRQGSPTGRLLVTIQVPNTGGFQNFQTFSGTSLRVNGVRDIFFVFKGGNGFLMDLESFRVD